MKCNVCGHELTESEVKALKAEIQREQEREKAIAWQGLCDSGQVAHVDTDD